MMNDENKYDDLIKTLKELQQIKAPPNFEADLKRKLNEEKVGQKSKRSVKEFFVPSKLIPSFGIAGVVIIVFLIINLKTEDVENPLMMEPKVREDIFKVEDIDLLQAPDREQSARMDANEKKDIVDKKNKEQGREGMQSDNLPKGNILAESETISTDSNLTDRNEITASDEYSSPRATGLAIRKSGLNFRQINPTKVEQEEIQNLKKNVQIKNKKKKID
jgi:hypothetical protein